MQCNGEPLPGVAKVSHQLVPALRLQRCDRGGSLGLAAKIADQTLTNNALAAASLEDLDDPVVEGEAPVTPELREYDCEGALHDLDFTIHVPRNSVLFRVSGFRNADPRTSLRNVFRTT